MVTLRERAPEELLSALNPDPLVASLLFSRGISSRNAADAFITPSYTNDIYDPFLLPDMERAVARIEEAMARNERIGIWSDYDCDGIPAAVILADVFLRFGYANVEHYVPHRVREGFGLNQTGIDELAGKKVRLLITLDCGTANVSEVAHANQQGMEVIITDHHLPGVVLPNAFAIINPKLPESDYPDDRLCGAGVSWKLAHALMRKRAVPEGQEKWLLDMAGLATIADMVPLLGENRAIAKYGITVLRKSRRPGLQALLRKVRVRQGMLSEEDISFSIVPRINAASRMGHADMALQLLTSSDLAEAGALADALEKMNNERKGVVAAMVKDAKRRLLERESIAPVIVIGNPDWKPSLLGLVAQSLTRDFARPAFVWGREESTTIKGSVRSSGINVHELMQSASEVFLEHGGHAFSGGFSTAPDRVHLIEPALVSALSLVEPAAAQTLMADAQLSLSDLSSKLLSRIEMLSPYGEGNPRPQFLFEGVTVSALRSFGKGNDHVEATFSKGTNSATGIAFFRSPEQFLKPLVDGHRADILATIERPAFGSGVRLRLIEAL